MTTPVDPNTLCLDDLFTHLVDADWLAALINQAHREDMGISGDVTSDMTISATTRGAAAMRTRADGRLAGAILLDRIARRYDPELRVDLHCCDGELLGSGDTVATITGPLRSLLAAERVMLNMVCHLSGIATLTTQYVNAVAGTHAAIMDTRKTIPGYRGLAKYAVRCGRGVCHRIGLYDAVLMKDNHIAHVHEEDLSTRINAAASEARRREPKPTFIEVEVDSLKQLQEVLKCDVDVVLLDNMLPGELREAVAMRDAAGHRAKMEASGSVSLNTVRAIAESGVDRISVGALTHSAPALDFGLDMTD